MSCPKCKKDLRPEKLFSAEFSFIIKGKGKVRIMTFSNTPLKGKSIAELEFLTGHWKGKAGDDIIEEYWLPEVEGNKACVFRWIKNGEGKKAQLLWWPFLLS